MRLHRSYRRNGSQTVISLRSKRPVLRRSGSNCTREIRNCPSCWRISPADCVDSALATGIGTGLYAARRIDENRHFLGERVASHYKDGQAGWLDAIDVIAISDPSVRAEALRDGFVDVAELPAPDGVLNRGEFAYHPSSQDIAIAARRGVGMPRVIGARGALDDGRLAERWWIA